MQKFLQYLPMNRIACGDAIAHPFFTEDKDFMENELPRLPAKWPEPTPEQQFQEFDSTLEALIDLEMSTGPLTFAGLASSTSSGFSSGNAASQPSGTASLELASQQQRSIATGVPLSQIPAQGAATRGPSGDFVGAFSTSHSLQRRWLFWCSVSWRPILFMHI